MTPEERIQALEAELAALRADMQTFTHTVSHDLRAPLRHIVSYAQLVQEDAGPQLNAEVQGFLATMTDSARHMARLLDGLTALSQLGTAPVLLEPVPLQEMVRDIAAKLGQQHPTRQLDWRIAPNLPTVQADAALVRLALTQVLGNAVKFTAPREMAVIEISAQESEAQGVRCAALQVRDNGVGYNPALQSALFQVFGRLHSAKQFEGMGIGLVQTRKALQRMGGSAAAEGVVDGGCCITLTLPLA